MINALLQEFLAVSKYLQSLAEKSHEIAFVKGDFLMVDKLFIINLLNRNLYETAEYKLMAWKGLNWIDTDEGRLTKRVRKEGHTLAVIKIRLSVVRTVQKLSEKSL
ncbi:hypothetical protein [Clostridium minihomine]|uniref:TcpK family conjugal transfer DNA-binding protein n=1 Tax=Clostridium minihomine TaxID=2045012 RepID=UPI000C78C88A|nr:hypothetical protein [Clostridium minihomine]